MSILKQGKMIVAKITGWQRPSRDDLDRMVRPRKANTFRFKDDSVIPNHPHWLLVVYRGAVKLPAVVDSAATFEDLFARNGWQDPCRNGIYDYAHYHSSIHDVLGVARSAKVQFGGKRGRTVTIKAGDVAVLPAGTGHQSLGASEDFLVVGVYPPDGTYDECTGSGYCARAVETIPKVRKPGHRIPSTAATVRFSTFGRHL